jgi:hypothetical protein
VLITSGKSLTARRTLEREFMPDVVIAAIARIPDDAETEQILAQCAGLETSRLTLFRKDHVREVAARSRMHFITFRGAPVASGSHGTNVPGMGRTLALNPYVVDAPGMDHLKDIGITLDAGHYYNIAIDEGRSVVTYVTSAEDAPSVEEQFRACGFVKIRRFPWAENSAGACGY